MLKLCWRERQQVTELPWCPCGEDMRDFFFVGFSILFLFVCFLFCVCVFGWFFFVCLIGLVCFVVVFFLIKSILICLQICADLAQK